MHLFFTEHEKQHEEPGVVQLYRSGRDRSALRQQENKRTGRQQAEQRLSVGSASLGLKALYLIWVREVVNWRREGPARFWSTYKSGEPNSRRRSSKESATNGRDTAVAVAGGQAARKTASSKAAARPERVYRLRGSPLHSRSRVFDRPADPARFGQPSLDSSGATGRRWA